MLNLKNSSPRLALFLLSFGLVFLVAENSFAATAATELADYTSIQSLLAKNTFAGVNDAAKKLSTDAKTNHHAELSKASDQLAGAKNLDEARDQFVNVSNQILPIAKAEKNKNLEIVYCPMKKARWVQKAGKIENPYYGDDMRECGVKEK